MVELKDTVDLMLSEDYKDRVKAEYYQLKIRIEKLKAAIRGYDNGEVNLDAPPELFRQQLDYMINYKGILEQRASYEGITL
jgi:hypothetical protein